MKINFWQVLGVLLILAGVIGVIYEKNAKKSDPTPAPTPAETPATQPTTQP